MRGNDYLLGAGADAAAHPAVRRGLPTGVADWGVGNCSTPADGDWTDAHVWLCRGLDFLTLKYTVPDLRVSGSDVLWAPVAWSSVATTAMCGARARA